MKEDEIYLIDMWRIFVREWRWFAVPLVAVLAIAFAFTHFARRQWQASAWIQIGVLGTTPAGHDPKVEPFARAIDRMKTRMFQDGVLDSQGIPLKGREAALYRKSLKLDPDPYANLIRLDVRADSPAQARRLALSTAGQLQAIHQRIEATTLKLAHQRLQAIESELRDALAERDRLRHPDAPARTAGARDDGIAKPLLAGILAGQKDDAIRRLREERHGLRAQLEPRLTYGTSLPWPVYVPDRPVFPNVVLAWGLGILLGGALGVLAAVARNAVRRRRRAGARPPAQELSTKTVRAGTHA
jgi:uncharacterized protein involved in exopolysaccharide biosynthesis